MGGTFRKKILKIMDKNKPHGLTGKPSNATKPDDQKAESYIHARCTRSDKGMWKIAAEAKGMKLTEWIVETLNANTNKATTLTGRSRKVTGSRRGVDEHGFIIELELECCHVVELSREKNLDIEIPKQYLCDKCKK